MAEELAVRHLPSRDPQAGRNLRLNQALSQCDADFVAIFDADHAAKRSFLDATLGHFRDPRVAFVQAAQDFLDADAAPSRLAGGRRSDTSLFYRITQRGHDAANAALYCGSCAVFRRSALATIGGFPEDRSGAELDTSLAVHKAGLRSVYVAEPLAFGIAPPDARAARQIQRQRDRGALRLLLREVLFLRGRLTPAQRLSYLTSALASLNGWQQALCCTAPVWMLLSGNLPLVADLGLFASLFLPFQLLRVLADEEADRGQGRRRLIAAQDLQRLESLVRRNRGRPQALPTASVAPAPAPAVRLAPAVVRRIWPQLLVAGLNLGAITVGLFLAYRGSARALPADGLIAATIWAALNVLIAVRAMRQTADRPDEQRQARRFAIPLPASISVDGGAITMTVDNISSTGARLYGDFPSHLKPGDAIAGELYLPGDSLPFTGTVAALLKPDKPSEDGQYHAALGIAFRWPDRRAEDRLNLFLYGSDLEWQFQRPDCLGNTSREHITALFSRAPPDPLAGKYWAAIRYDADGEPGHGLISIASSPGPRVVVTEHPLPLTEPIQASKFSRRQPQGLRITPRRELARLATPTAMLYLTEVKTAPILEAMSSEIPTRHFGAAPS